MAEKKDWSVRLGDWRKAHDAIGAMLQEAEESDEDEPGLGRQEVYDGYIGLASMFRPRDAAGADDEVDHRRDFDPSVGSADSVHGMALDMRAAPPVLTRREAAARDAIAEAFPIPDHPYRNHT